MILFYGQDNEFGFLSNWYPASFCIDGFTYCHAEQYMMHRKALLFGDDKAAAKIMAETDPKKCKHLGRKVTPFDPVVWQGVSQVIVFRGLLEKFRQNPELKAALLDTGEEMLVEASPFDAIWGIKMGKNNPDAQHPEKWKGKNLLGFSLMQVRDVIKKESL